MGYWEDAPLEELLDRIRHEYDEATWNEQKVCSGGSFHYSPSPLMLMVDAFDSLEMFLPIVEERRAGLAVPDGGSTAYLWIESWDGTCARAHPVKDVHYEAWPRGSDYTGPAHYFYRDGDTRTFEVAAEAAARIEHVAKSGKLALVVLRGDTFIAAAY